MISGSWLQSFPLARAQDVTEVLLAAWSDLASIYRSHFNKDSKEPQITRVLTDRAASLSRDRGLSGKWLPEVVISVVDMDSGEIKEERRADIVYLFHGDHETIELVFEFKLLKRQGYARIWASEDGVGRFVDGQYSKGQSTALMVGVLHNDRRATAAKIVKSLEKSSSSLRMQHHASGGYFSAPSLLSGSAEFDTIHERPPELAPPHGTIMISHIIIEFGY